MHAFDRQDIDTSLRAILDADPGLREVLEQSLAQAADRAHEELEPSLVAAFRWPRTIDEYVDYLAEFARWIPQQSDAEAWSGDSEHADEISDRMAHFFWIVDQQVGDSDTGVAESSPDFRTWLTDYTRQWGDFLDTPQSFSDDILDTFRQHSKQYRIEESLIDGRPNMPSGWQTFNQFMARELNAGLRPIADPGNNLVVTSPADCDYRQTFGIGEDSAIPDTRVKKTATYGNIRDLLADSPYADAFAGGTFVHYMLPPNAYHRFHAPVAGRVADARVIHGQVYLQVEVTNGRFQSEDRTESGYEFFQTRGVVVLDTADSDAGDLGLVAAIPVGMSQVSSVVLTAKEGVELAKGAEFGYFQFGGSDMILLFQRGVELDIDTSSEFRFVGTVAARVGGRPGSTSA